MIKLINEAKRFQELANIKEAEQSSETIEYLGFNEDNIGMYGSNDYMAFEISKRIFLYKNDFENDDMFEEFFYKAKNMNDYPKFKQFVSDYIKQRINDK
jgi:hypothetical protein